MMATALKVVLLATLCAAAYGWNSKNHMDQLKTKIRSLAVDCDLEFESVEKNMYNQLNVAIDYSHTVESMYSFLTDLKRNVTEQQVQLNRLLHTYEKIGKGEVIEKCQSTFYSTYYGAREVKNALEKVNWNLTIWLQEKMEQFSLLLKTEKNVISRTITGYNECVQSQELQTLCEYKRNTTFKAVTQKIKAKNCMLKSIMDQILCDYHTHYKRSAKMEASHFISIMTECIPSNVKIPKNEDLDCEELEDQIKKSLEGDNLDHFPAMRDMFKKIRERFDGKEAVIPIKFLQTDITPGANYKTQNAEIAKTFEQVLEYLKQLHDLKKQM